MSDDGREFKKLREDLPLNIYGSTLFSRKSQQESFLAEEKKSDDVTPPKRIMLIFHRPEDQKNSLDFGHRGYIHSKENQEGTVTIYVNKNDFENGKLKEDKDTLKKYASVQMADPTTEFEIHAHGSRELPHIIGSDRGAYEQMEQTQFTDSEVASIFDLMTNTTARKTKDELIRMQELPDPHLHISLLTCEGQQFAKSLFEKLSQGENPLLCRITAVRDGLYQYYQLRNFWRDKPLANYCDIKLTKAIMAIGVTSALTVWALVPLTVGGGLLIAKANGANLDGLKAQPENLVKYSAIILGVGIGLALAMYAVHLASLKSENQAKVEVVPDFEALGNSQNPDSIPSKVMDKATYETNQSSQTPIVGNF